GARRGSARAAATQTRCRADAATTSPTAARGSPTRSEASSLPRATPESTSEAKPTPLGRASDAGSRVFVFETCGPQVRAFSAPRRLLKPFLLHSPANQTLSTHDRTIARQH